MKWRACSFGKFYDRGEGAVVYFDSASGNTVLITNFAAEILRTLTRSSLSTDAIFDLHGGDLEDGTEAERKEAVKSILDDLAAGHLIETF